MSHTLLIIDDEENMRHMLQAMLSKKGYRIELSCNGKEAYELVKTTSFDFILCDVRMPEMDGLEFLESAKEYLKDTTVIMMSAYGTVDLAMKAMQNGAYDYISKPFKTDEVLLSLKKAEEREELRQENRQLKETLHDYTKELGFGRIVGECRKVQQVLELAKRVAQHDTTVLITGESGTGKELVAQGIHQSSKRADKKMIAINCGSIPTHLIESEFFGYQKGAFTGADRNKIGLFESAQQSTIFLDEIGELPLDLQVKLLRVLQEREIRPIGSNSNKKIDVRVIAATAKDLNEEVSRGTFRQDLLFRLNVVEVTLPPLRERENDIKLLADHFVKLHSKRFQTRVTGASDTALAIMRNYHWPGNIRELSNAIEHGLIYAEGNTLQPADLPANIYKDTDESQDMVAFSDFSIRKGKEFLERQLIERALNETGGNKSKAAALLELSYPSLLKKIKEYDIH